MSRLRLSETGLLSLALLVALAATLSADPAPAPTALAVYPTEIQLDDLRDRQGLIVQARYADGTTRDVTELASIAVLNTRVATLAGGVLTPRASGATAASVRFGGRQLEVPLRVTAATARSISFRNDCLPVLTRAGCNTGSCHGSSRGKDGFRLSLFGYDPAGDYERITREQSGRRINRMRPESSLLLQKASGRVRHTGGQRIAPGGAEEALLLEWLNAGAPRDPKTLPALERLDLYPLETVIAERGSQRILVQARYADGTDRDVTGLAALLSSDGATASVGSGSTSGRVVAGRRGAAFLSARFGELTVAAPVLVVPKAVAPLADLDETNPIDAHVNARLRKLRLVPSPLIDDATFYRRVSLDVVGLLPTPAELRAFVADADPNKRPALVDRLLERKEFAELWVMVWAERLLIRSSQQISDKAMFLYDQWLEEQIAGNVPVDDMVSGLLTATGGVFDTPQTNFYQAEPDNKKLAENVAQVFLGMRLQCAQCHDHPFDRWTQDDYYGFAAFFGQVGRKRGGDPRETVIHDRRSGEVKHPVTKKTVAPKFLGGPRPETKGKDRRRVLAEWITDPKNPYFAPSLANMVWTQFFGVGIVHEPDDFRVSNPPSNPALLAFLAERFAASRYDLKGLVRLIVTSQTYQRSTQPNETNAEDTRNFSRAQVRRLRAEVLLDAIAQVTEAPNAFRGLPKGARAVQIADGSLPDYFLTTFGRSQRGTVCSCEVKTEPNLSQALHLINGDTVDTKIRKGNVVGRLLGAKTTPLDVARELTQRCLGRDPTGHELDALGARLAGAKAQPVLEDFFWALLNSREFLLQH